MSALKELKALSLADSRRRYPNMPEEVRSCRNYTDKTSNGLTRAILDYLKFSGWQAERVSNTGRYVDGSKVITDVTGFQRRIGSGKWIPGSGTRGTSDISAVISGKAVKIEIKMKDKQSPDQKKYQESVEKAGGLYWLVRSFDEFLNLYNQLNGNN
jgi:hypothetical protein